MNIDALADVANPDQSLTSGYATGLTIAALLVGAALLGLTVAALVQIVGDDGVSGLGKSVWVVGVIGFPLIGSLLWFLLGRASARSMQLYRCS